MTLVTGVVYLNRGLARLLLGSQKRAEDDFSLCLKLAAQNRETLQKKIQEIRQKVAVKPSDERRKMETSRRGLTDLLVLRSPPLYSLCPGQSNHKAASGPRLQARSATKVSSKNTREHRPAVSILSLAVRMTPIKFSTNPWKFGVPAQAPKKTHVLRTDQAPALWMSETSGSPAKCATDRGHRLRERSYAHHEANAPCFELLAKGLPDAPAENVRGPDRTSSSFSSGGD